MPDYKNSDMCNAINEYVRNPNYRQVLHLRYCEGQTYEKIAEICNYSPQHVKHICAAYKAMLIDHLSII